MLEDILVLERNVFFFLNGSNFPVLDRFMWLYSGKLVWLPVAFFVLVLLVYKKNWREILLIVLSIVLVVTLCDQFASHVCKPMFTRFRPTHHPDFMEHVKTLFDYRGGRYGFISSHAANAFGFAVFLSLLMRDKLLTGVMLVWAVLMAYSRIYLGVHFISDIIPGIVTGSIFGYLVYRSYICFYKLWYRKNREIKRAECMIYSTERKHFIAYGVLFTILFIFIWNVPLMNILY